MGGSCPLLDDWFAARIIETDPLASCLDVGAGQGKRGRVVRDDAPECQLFGMEPAAELQKPEWYTGWFGVSIEQALRDRSHFGKPFDLIVFGDVLEHLPLDTARSAIHWAAYNARRVIALWPVGFIQGEEAGGPLEVHMCTPSLADFNPHVLVDYRREEGPGWSYHGVMYKGWR